MRQVASLEIAQEIKRRIIADFFKPGDSLSALSIAAQLKISRSPVRDALRELAREGLVTILPRRGAFVRELSVDEITDLFIMRYAIEPFICMLAATRRLSEDVARLRETVDRIHELWKERQHAPESESLLRKFEEADAAFHTAIVDASHSEVAAELFEKLQVWRVLSRKALPKHLVLPPNFDSSDNETVRYHEEILHAIEQREPTLAQQKMMEHLQSRHDAAIAWINPKGVSKR